MNKTDLAFIINAVNLIKNIILFILGVILVPFVFFDILLIKFNKALSTINKKYKIFINNLKIKKKVINV